jgi:hypothetical protein
MEDARQWHAQGDNACDQGTQMELALRQQAELPGLENDSEGQPKPYQPGGIFDPGPQTSGSADRSSEQGDVCLKRARANQQSDQESHAQGGDDCCQRPGYLKPCLVTA